MVMRGWWNTATPRGQALDQGAARRAAAGPDWAASTRRASSSSTSPALCDQFGQHHRDGLQRLDLDFLVAARFDVLDGQHADRPLAPHDRHARRSEWNLVLAGFGAVGKSGCAAASARLSVSILLGDGADQALADRQPGDVHRALLEAAGGEQFEHAFAQQVDRADLAIEALADDLDDRLSLACALLREAITSCRRVRIVRAAATAVIMPGPYPKAPGLETRRAPPRETWLRRPSSDVRELFLDPELSAS